MVLFHYMAGHIMAVAVQKHDLASSNQRLTSVARWDHVGCNDSLGIQAMTVCVGIVVNDCLVFSADSAATLVLADAAGNSTVANVFQNGDKVYNLHRKLPIVAMTCWMGNIGSQNVSSIAKELRSRFSGDDQEWRLDRYNYDMREVAIKAKRILYDEHFSSLNPPPAAPHSLEFWIGGYASDKTRPAEVWKISIVNGECPDPELQVLAGPTIFWGGQTAPIHRLIFGHDVSVVDVLVRNGIEADAAAHAAQLFRNELVAELVTPTMPVRDAIDLADFLVDMTKRYFRFLPGADIVGGETDIAVVTRYEGFKWIKRKHFYPASLNPREVDHA